MNKIIKQCTLKDLCNFIRNNLDVLEHISGSGSTLDFPDFELLPMDYLNYAEEALATPTDANRINTISHLKRAVECECDTLLIVLGLQKKAKQLNMPQKLKFIDNLLLMPSRSILALNKIRNKVEHEYSNPEMEDITVYFDLVAGFIAALEGALFMLSINSGTNWYEVDYKPDEGRNKFLHASYKFDETSICFNFRDEKDECEYKANVSNWEEFGQSLGLFFLIIKHQDLVSANYVTEKLPA